MNKLPISVIVVIYHEESVLDQCLRSCADIVDEIIVVHDGPCQDRSLQIARQYTDIAYEGPRVGEAEPHRIKALEQSRNDWVIFLDGDEYLSDILQEHLPDLISQQEYQGYDLTWPTLYRGKYYQAYWKRALANKKYFYFIGVPHQYFKPIDGSIKVKKLEYGLEHKPKYDNLTLKTFIHKWYPWTKIHARYFLQDFNNLPKYNCPLTDWERNIRLRIDHPLVLGICGSLVYQLYALMKSLIVSPKIIFLKAGCLQMLYHVCLYYFVWKYKREPI